MWVEPMRVEPIGTEPMRIEPMRVGLVRIEPIRIGLVRVEPTGIEPRWIEPMAGGEWAVHGAVGGETVDPGLSKFGDPAPRRRRAWSIRDARKGSFRGGGRVTVRSVVGGRGGERAAAGG